MALHACGVFVACMEKQTQNCLGFGLGHAADDQKTTDKDGYMPTYTFLQQIDRCFFYFLSMRCVQPTRGLIPFAPRKGGVQSWLRTSVVGPITRCTRDAAIYLDVTVGCVNECEWVHPVVVPLYDYMMSVCYCVAAVLIH